MTYIDPVYEEVVVPALKSKGLKPLPTRGHLRNYAVAWAKRPDADRILVVEAFTRGGKAFTMKYVKEDPNTPKGEVNDPKEMRSWANLSGAKDWSDLLNPQETGPGRWLDMVARSLSSAGSVKDRENTTPTTKKDSAAARRVAGAWLRKVAMEHSSPDALKKYLKQYPNSKVVHTVKKPSGGKGPKDEGSVSAAAASAVNTALKGLHSSKKLDGLFAKLTSSAAKDGFKSTIKKAEGLGGAAGLESIQDSIDELTELRSDSKATIAYAGYKDEAEVSDLLSAVRAAYDEVEKALHNAGFKPDYGDNDEPILVKKAMRTLRSQWEKLNIFRWSSPAPNIDGSVPKPWRVSDKDLALKWLKKMFNFKDIYVEYESERYGKNQIKLWVGLRDNRDKAAHADRIMHMFDALRDARFPVIRSRDSSHMFLVDDIDRDALRR